MQPTLKRHDANAFDSCDDAYKFISEKCGQRVRYMPDKKCFISVGDWCVSAFETSRPTYEILPYGGKQFLVLVTRHLITPSGFEYQTRDYA